MTPKMKHALLRMTPKMKHVKQQKKKLNTKRLRPQKKKLKILHRKKLKILHRKKLNMPPKRKQSALLGKPQKMQRMKRRVMLPLIRLMTLNITSS